jgi:hypothetical protein
VTSLALSSSARNWDAKSSRSEIAADRRAGDAHGVRGVSNLRHATIRIKSEAKPVSPQAGDVSTRARVLYGCETWSLTLREEYRLEVFENRVPRRIFGPKRDEVTGEWRKLHDEELHDLYSSPNIRIIKARTMRCAGHVARMGVKRNAYRLLVGKPEGRRPLGRLRRRIDLVEVGWGDVDWIGLAQDRDRWRALVNAVMNLRVP